MVTTPTKPGIAQDDMTRLPMASWTIQEHSSDSSELFETASYRREAHPASRDALQALLAFSAMHQQIRRRRALAARHLGFEAVPAGTEMQAEFALEEQFVLDEVLQLVAERAIAITGADGLAIGLAEDDAIVLRASAGSIKPDVGAHIQRDSDFSGACFRNAEIIRCDDTETDDRVNLYACRQLGARSMVAVPLCGRRRVIGLLQAFSGEPFGFNDSDLASLEMLAELIIAALKPEDEDRFARSANAAEAKLVGKTAAVLQLPSSETKVPVTVSGAPLEEPSPTLAKEQSTAVLTKKEELPTSAKAGANAEHIAGLALEVIEDAAEKHVAPAASAPERSLARHPGIVLVFALVIVAGLTGGGLWWKLKRGGFAASSHAPALQTDSANGSATPSSVPQSQPTSTAGTFSQSTADASSQTTQASDDLKSSAEGESENNATQEPAKIPRITGIRHWSSADSSTVVLDLEDQVQYEAHRLSNPDRIYFDLHDTTLASGLDGKTIDIGDALLARVRVAQPIAGLTRLVLETKANSDYSVSLEPNPYRLLVQVTRVGSTPKPQVNLFPGTAEADHNKLSIVVPPPTKEDLQFRARVPRLRIVVDAGHGGWDLGTVGRRGLLEKDLVLEIAQRLGKLLESRLGADVILTRNDDNYIPLDERASVANQAHADFFVSVHANYSDLPSARGVETYYTNVFASPSAKELELRPAGLSKAPTPMILSAAELHDKIEQSRRLAGSVQRALYGTLAAENPGLRDRGVKEASYVVLTETAMPGILAEVSFVSSPTDEQKLRSDGYREQIAEALYKGIARYATASHPVKVASVAK